jgi:Holliday junction resolvase RusA-like endonuclease
MRLELPYPPSSNVYWRSVRGRVIVSLEARKYRQCVRLRALTQLPKPLRPYDGPIVLSLALYRPAKRGDLSNRIKIVEDALQGLLYEDDSQVVELHAARFDDATCPRVVVTVEAMKPR